MSIAGGTQLLPRQDINSCTVLNQMQFEALDLIANHVSPVLVGDKLHVTYEYRSTSAECTRMRTSEPVA
jgi:hypothetical protein